MNVLYINANQRNKLCHAAGYATHMAKTIKGFEAAGHRVIKFLAGETQEAEEAKQTYRRMSNYLPHNVSRMLRDVYEVVHDHKLYRKWLALAAEQDVQFAYERMNQLHTCGLRLARRLGIPFVIEVNDPMRETVTVDLSGPMKRYAICLEDRLVKQSDFVVLGSEELKNSYVRRGASAEKLLVLYPTADLQLFRPLPSQEEIRQRFELQDKIVLGLVAGDTTAGWRRTDLLLETVAELARKHPQVCALVVGEGRIPANHGSDRAGARDCVRFTGKIPYAEVPRYINAMDICVIPNATWYGSPTKLFEYGAMAKAVVAPDYPPIKEVVEDGVSGLIFERENPVELKRRLEALVTDAEWRTVLGQNLRRKIEENFTWERNTAAVIQAVKFGPGACVPRQARELQPQR